MLESVVRDVHENRRFYITYRSVEVKRRVAGRGFRLGSLHLKPEDDLTEACISYPPHYCAASFSQDRFQMSPGGTRIGGYTFKIALHPGRSLPAKLTYHGDVMHIKLKDAPKFCRFCERYGHTIGA